MTSTVDITIEPSHKYREVINGEWADDGDLPETEEEFIEEAEHHEATEAYLEAVENTPDPEDYGHDPEDLEVLTWSDLSPSRDPDLMAKIATYFDGMDPDEPTDQLRAKCRLLDVDLYANAQFAAQSELRGA